MLARFPRPLAAPILLLSLLLSGCGALPQLAAPSSTALPSPTAPPPTPTPLPLAARVNGQPITLEEFERELRRFEQAQSVAGTELATHENAKQHVLQTLIDLKLLMQGALTNDLPVEEAQVEERLKAMAEAMGEATQWEAWLAANEYSEAALRTALWEEMLVMAMVTSLADTVPEEMEQVHARHILVATQEEAEALLAKLQAGTDFALLAQQVSLDASTRPAGGDLGWFPRGFLLQPEIEEAAFALQPGEISSVVRSELGYHLVETLERGPHPLDATVRIALQRKAVEDWLRAARDSAEIEIFLSP